MPQEYYERYKNVDPSSLPGKNKSLADIMTDKDKDAARRVYAMVTAIDDNVSRLWNKLKELGIADNTIVIFMTDNGPQQTRYNAGMRGKKGSVYRGGVRVPFFLRYPPLSSTGKTIQQTAAHIDVLPTLAAICNFKVPSHIKMDGINLLPFIQNKKHDIERNLFFYWSRRYPELYNNIAFQKGKYKLVGNVDYNSPISDFELYDVERDSLELYNIIDKHIATANAIKKELTETYDELISSPNITNPENIIIGSAKENPVLLNRNDADGERGIWNQEEIYAYWNVNVLPGIYNIKFKFIKPVKENGTMLLAINGRVYRTENKEETDIINMNRIQLPAIKGKLTPEYIINGKSICPFYVEIEKVSL